MFLLSLMSLIMSAQTVENVYHFENPKFKEVMGYQQVYFDGCMQLGEIGYPSLPYQTVRLLLPQGAEASSVELIYSDFVEIEGSYELFPVQQAVPYSRPDMYKFSKNEEIYASKNVYPAERQTDVNTQYLNGYGFAFVNFTPVQYVPATGKLSFAKTVKVVVNTVSEREDHSMMLWGNSHFERSASRLADNPEMMSTYKTRDVVMSGYDMLVITLEDYIDGYSEYVNFYDSIGVRTRIVGLEEIYDEMDGIDNQDKIRNYIIQEYQNEGISIVTLGGDVNIVPYRGFYCIVNGDTEDYGIPADMYYACLDGDWNENGNNKWGEPDEADMLPELAISRMSFTDDATQAIMIHKTLSYQRTPVMGEFNDIVFGSELMDDIPTYGGDYLELLIGDRDVNGYFTVGIPEDYNFTRVYAEHGNWSGQNLMNAVNEGAQYLHHAGHANADFVAGWYNSDITDANFHALNGIDHNFTFMHSHGCICGSFDTDCIMERMTKINNFCVATAGNSRYGWYVPGGTEAPAMHLHREMLDSQYGDKMNMMALALRESKIKSASWTQYADALLWNTYCLNILGDGAVSIWLDEPFEPTIDCHPVIMLGAQDFEITITDVEGSLLENFRCSMYLDDELIGLAVTDSLGYANIEFESPISGGEDMVRLVITGPNAFPQIMEIDVVSEDIPYVVYADYSLNDADNQIDFMETHTINVTFRNSGNVAASDVSATLTCDKPEYINITNAVAQIGSVDGGSEVTIDDVFEFTVCDSVPNGTNIKFFVSCTDGNETWESRFQTMVYAPEFQLTEIVMDDSASNDNNQLEPGETATISFTGENCGNSKAENVTFAVFCSAPEFSFEESEMRIDSLAVGESFTYDFTFTLDETAELGVAYELILATYSGRYVFFDSYLVIVGNTMEDFETGDFSAFEWEFNETAWIIDSVDAYQGDYCARSGYTYDYSSSDLYIEIEVFNDSEISFYKKVSSEQNWDKLFFYIDDTEYAEWSGEVNWSQETYTLTAGTHVLRWSYEKDSSMSQGDDCAWIDNIVLPPTSIILDVKTVEVKNVSLYPNPTDASVVLQLGDNQYDVTVYNTFGQVVDVYSSANGDFEIDMSDYASGMYFVNIKNDSYNITEKVIKK